MGRRTFLLISLVLSLGFCLFWLFLMFVVQFMQLFGLLVLYCLCASIIFSAFLFYEPFSSVVAGAGPDGRRPGRIARLLIPDRSSTSMSIV